MNREWDQHNELSSMYPRCWRFIVGFTLWISEIPALWVLTHTIPYPSWRVCNKQSRRVGRLHEQTARHEIYTYIYILHIYIYTHYVYFRSWFLTYHRNKSNKWTKARMWVSWFLVIGIPYNMESYRRKFPYKQWQQVQSGDVGPLAHGPNYSIVQSTLTIELFMGQDFHSYVINNQRVHVYRL